MSCLQAAHQLEYARPGTALEFQNSFADSVEAFSGWHVVDLPVFAAAVDAAAGGKKSQTMEGRVVGMVIYDQKELGEPVLDCSYQDEKAFATVASMKGVVDEETSFVVAGTGLRIGVAGTGLRIGASTVYQVEWNWNLSQDISPALASDA